MKPAIITTAITLTLLLLATGKIKILNLGSSKKPSIVEVIEKTTTPATPTPKIEKSAPPATTPKGWSQTEIEDEGFAWYKPENDNTTEWFVIENWNIQFKLKNQICLMEFKNKEDVVTAIKVERGVGNHPKIGDTFSKGVWTSEQYENTFHESTHVRFSSINPGSKLYVQIGRRSW